MKAFSTPLSRKLALAIDCNHRLDNTYDGRYILRLPDLTLVYSDRYEEALREYETRREQQGEAVDRPPRALGTY